MNKQGNKLFQALAGGERWAFDEICTRYGERAAGLARRFLGKALRGKIETADLVQSAFLDIYKNSKRVRFESEKAFLCWLHVVLERKIIRAARHWKAASRNMRREVMLDRERQVADPRSETPSRIFLRGEVVDQLTRALASLTPGDRKVIISRLLLDLPWSAVADSLGTTREAAQMRLLRARRRMAAFLKPQCRSNS